MDKNKQFLFNRELYLKNLYHLCKLLGITEKQLLLMPKNELDLRLDALRKIFCTDNIAKYLTVYLKEDIINRKLKEKCCSDISLQLTRSNYADKSNKLSKTKNESTRSQVAKDIQNENRIKGGANGWATRARSVSRNERLNRSGESDDIWSMLARVCCCKCDMNQYGYTPGSSDPDITLRNNYNRREMSYSPPLRRNMTWQTRRPSYTSSPYTPESGWSRVPDINIRSARTPDDYFEVKRRERLMKAEGSPKGRPHRHRDLAKRILKFDDYTES